MTKADLLDAIVKTHPDLTKKQAGSVVDVVFARMATASIEEGAFAFRGFCGLKASKTVGFRPAKALKDRL